MSGMEKYILRIDGEELNVSEKVYLLFEKMQNDADQMKKQESILKNALCKANEMLEDAQIYVAHLSEGKDKEAEAWAAGAKLKAELMAEARDGLIGWLMKNWQKICVVTCDCGNLISYDVVRTTSDLKCKHCAPTGIKLAQMGEEK